MLPPARSLPLLLALLLPTAAPALAPDPREAPGEVETLISWLLADGRNLTEIAFSEVVAATAGKEVIPVDLGDPDDQRIIRAIGQALDNVLAEINLPDHPIHQVGRINEVSGHLENLLLDKLNDHPELACAYPITSDGNIQRSGYPDLRLIDESTERIFYLDPKLYATGSEQSTFRTFYFEPKAETNKILDDASHLIAGIAHGGKADGRWTFLRWNLIDLHTFKVRLKAEFQGSNKDLYRPESIIATSTDPERKPSVSNSSP